MTLATHTVWFDCASDDPPAPGWYDVLYEGEPDDTDEPSRMYWDGAIWKCHPDLQSPSCFGNFDNGGERWRGAATPIGGYYV